MGNYWSFHGSFLLLVSTASVFLPVGKVGLRSSLYYYYYYKVTGLVSGIFHIYPTRFDVTAAVGASRDFGIGGSGLTAVARVSHSNCNFSILAYKDRLITITEDSYAGGKVNPWVSGYWFTIR